MNLTGRLLTFVWYFRVSWWHGGSRSEPSSTWRWWGQRGHRVPGARGPKGTSRAHRSARHPRKSRSERLRPDWLVCHGFIKENWGRVQIWRLSHSTEAAHSHQNDSEGFHVLPFSPESMLSRNLCWPSNLTSCWLTWIILLDQFLIMKSYLLLFTILQLLLFYWLCLRKLFLLQYHFFLPDTDSNILLTAVYCINLYRCYLMDALEGTSRVSFMDFGDLCSKILRDRILLGSSRVSFLINKLRCIGSVHRLMR